MRLRYTLPALADLNFILEHIAAHSPRGAKSVRRRIKTLIEVLLRHPNIGRQTIEPAIRRVVASPYPYLIFYEVMEGELIIHAVRHAARNPAGMPDA